VSAVCDESEGASGARSGFTRGGEGEAELAWAGSEAANGLGVEGPRQGCACLRRSEGALEEYARKRTHAFSERKKRAGTSTSRVRFVGFLEKGSVESTHKVPTSHYHTKHRTDGRCHRGRVARWTNTPARIFKDPAPTPRPSFLVCFHRGQMSRMCSRKYRRTFTIIHFRGVRLASRAPLRHVTSERSGEPFTAFDSECIDRRGCCHCGS